MLSASSVEWIDEAMAHNSAHDGEVWMRQRTREAHQAFDTLPLWDFSNVDAHGQLLLEIGLPLMRRTVTTAEWSEVGDAS